MPLTLSRTLSGRKRPWMYLLLLLLRVRTNDQPKPTKPQVGRHAAVQGRSKTPKLSFAAAQREPSWAVLSGQRSLQLGRLLACSGHSVLRLVARKAARGGARAVGGGEGGGVHTSSASHRRVARTS
jgi:hypothetical protein